MIRFLTAVLMLASLTVRADTQVPHTFEDGEVISAAEFNQNFDVLESAIDDIPAGATGPQGPQGEQGPAGPAGVAAGLTCTTDQIIKWDDTNDVWVCANLTGPQIETVTVDCSADLATPDTCLASCATGKQLVSGGCQFNFLNQAIYLKSIPDGNSWSCGIGDGGQNSHVDSAYAICQ